MSIALKGGKPELSEFLPYGKQYIDDDDIANVVETLRSAYITTGPKIAEFEKKLCDITGAGYAVAVSSGTAALHTACAAADIGLGDEVITTPMTFAATANCILYRGGTPVFADIDPGTWNIDPREIKKKITDKTKAVIAVDFTGQSARLDDIREICEENNLKFIEDAAHAFGTKYKGVPVGGISDITAFSFHPVKTVTCGEGGAVTTNNEKIYEKAGLFRTHSITRERDLMTGKPFEGYNEQIGLGYNYRMTAFQAALGISQIGKLSLFSRRRSEIVREYNNAFSKIPQITIQLEIPESDTTRHLYIIRINSSMLTADRSEIIRALNAENVGTQVHYIPVYYHPYYKSLGYVRGLCPVAEALYEEIITIPLYYSMTDENVGGVIRAVKKVIEYYSV